MRCVLIVKNAIPFNFESTANVGVNVYFGNSKPLLSLFDNHPPIWNCIIISIDFFNVYIEALKTATRWLMRTNFVTSIKKWNIGERSYRPNHFVVLYCRVNRNLSNGFSCIQNLGEQIAENWKIVLCRGWSLRFLFKGVAALKIIFAYKHVSHLSWKKYSRSPALGPSQLEA